MPAAEIMATEVSNQLDLQEGCERIPDEGRKA